MTATNKKTTGLWVTVSILGLFLFFSFLLNIGLFAGMSAGNLAGKASRFSGYPESQLPQFDEVWTFGCGKKKVVHIQLNGAIMREAEQQGFFPRVDIVQSVLSQIEAAANDDGVSAILMELNSPGGAVTPSDEIYAALLGFKERKSGRKVMVFTRDLAASGAYYIAMAGDYFVAEPTSIIGSVGVIMQSINMQGLAEKIGITDVTITAGKNKDLLNPFQPVDPEHVKNLQVLINDSYARFLAIVLHSRPEIDRDLLDGRVYSARDALNYKLIDEIGYWPTALSAVATLLDEEDIRLVRYEMPTGFAAFLAQMQMPDVQTLLRPQRAQMLYMWKP
jgi:protease-4